MIKINDVQVSVIVPVYNVEKYISQCLDSIINQDLKNIEIICVDDCSPDNSVNIITNAPSTIAINNEQGTINYSGNITINTSSYYTTPDGIKNNLGTINYISGNIYQKSLRGT